MTNSTRTILILAANPLDKEQLRLAAEERSIDDGLRRATHRDQLRLVAKQAVRPADVQRALLEYTPQIVHFCGHGTGSAGIYLENDQGQATLVTGTALSELFALFEDVACVVLNACYSEAQATAIAQYVPYVVGMNDQISDDAALRFAVAFYDAIGAGRSYRFAFRLGCNAISLAGLTEAEIPTFLAEENAAQDEQSLFISFVQDDQAWVEGFLVDALDTVGILTILQPLTVPLQGDHDKFTDTFPQRSQLLLVLSPNYPLAALVPSLIRHFGEATDQWPVRLLLLTPTPIPASVAALPLLNATDTANWPSVVERLARDLTHNTIQSAAQLVCPYPGMRAFDELNSHHFYGRSVEIDLLRSHLRLNPFIAVIGPSGSGKSSLVIAGLLPALRQPSTFFGPGSWLIKAMRPGTQPLTTLTETLEGLVDAATWQPLARVGAAALDRMLLVIDQFEEIFTFAESAQVRPFQDALLKLIDAPQCYVVITVRADFYVDLMNSPLWTQVSKRRLEVLPLKADGLREAIVKPAANSGVYIEEALVAQLLDDANEEPGVLPFVQETMVLLWEKLERRFLAATAYKQLSDGTQSSGLYLAMTQRANSTLNSLSPQQEIIARRILLRLIQFGEGRADTRRQQPVRNLLAHQEEQTLFTETLRKLTDERLLTLNAEEARSAETGEPKVDIAHEALLNGWPQLRTWINERRAAEQTRRRLEEKAAEWARLGKGEGGLLADVALAEAETWLQSPDAQELGASQELVALAAASRERLDTIANAERRTRRLRLILVSAIGLLIIALLAGGLWVQRQNTAQQQQIAENERKAADEANQLRLDAEAARNAAQQSADEAQQAQDLAEARLQESERQSNINRAQTVRVQSQLALERNAECSLALALNAYDLATTISDFAPHPFQDSVRTALQATRTEQVLPAHTSLNAVAWSHDDRTIAAGAQPSGGTQLWEATEDGFQEGTRIADSSWVGALAFSPDDRLLAIGNFEIVLWDRDEGEAAGTLRGHSQEVRVLAWHPTGRWLASGADDGTVTIWDTQEQRAVQTLTAHQESNGTDNIFGLAWSPDGAWLASAGLDNNIRIWDASGLTKGTLDKDALVLKATWNVNDQAQPIRLAWSPDGTQLAASYAAGTIQVWAIDTKASFTDNQIPVQTIEAHTGGVRDLAWNPDGTRLASSAEDQTIRIWDSQTLKPLATLSGHSDSVAGGVAWNADGTALASASSDQSVRVWRLTPGGVESQQIDGFLLDAVWHPDLKHKVAALSIATEQGFLIRLWDVENNSIRTITTTHRSTILRVAWSPDGKALATASSETEVHVYDAQTGERLHRLVGHTGPVSDVTWSPDGQQLASAGQSFDGIRVWQLRDGSSRQFSSSNLLNSLTWQPAGNYIAAGVSYGLVNVWNITTGQRYDWTGHQAAVLSVTWHPDGQWLASGGQDGQIILWDTSGAELTTGNIWKQGFDLGEQIWDLAWHGNLLAAAGANGSIKVWDVTTGEAMANYGGHDGAVRAVDWSPDGRYLITVGMTDGTALVHYANFVDDLLPIARQQLERGSRAADRERCLSESK